MLGKAKVEGFGVVGRVGHSDTPDWSFLYTASAVKDPKFNVGDKVELADGREFRYCKAGAAIASTDLAVSFAAACKISIEVFRAASVAGERVVRITEASITEDQLRGGTIIIYRNGYSTHCVRGILGNTASGTGNAVDITLDAGVPYALTTSDQFEVCVNPWGDVRQTNFGGAASFAGMPAMTASSGDYLWVQTAGPCWCAPQAGVQGAAYVRSVYFRHDGSLDIRANIGTYVTDQLAGFVLNYGATQGPPLIWLKVE